MKKQLTEAWGGFLAEFPWDWFVTLTYRDEVNSFRAHRLFRTFVKRLEKAAGTSIFWFRADEIGPRGGRFHIHALIGNVAHLRRMTWMKRWEGLGGYARILPFEPRKGAPYYCAKYVTKQVGDWDISDNLYAFRINQPILPLAGGNKTVQPLGPPISSPPILDDRLSTTRRRRDDSQYALLSQPDIVDSTLKPIRDVYQFEVTRGGKRRLRRFGTPLDAENDDDSI